MILGRPLVSRPGPAEVPAGAESCDLPSPDRGAVRVWRLGGDVGALWPDGSSLTWTPGEVFAEHYIRAARQSALGR